MIDLDEIDLKILHLIRTDSQRTLKDIGDIIGKQSSTVHNRVKKLEQIGVITKYSAEINMAKIGYPLVSFIMLAFDQQETRLDQEQVAEELANISRVEEVHLIAGEYDILLKVRASNIDDLGGFVTKELKEVQGIGRSRTFVSLKVVKETNDEPYLISQVAKMI